MTEKSLLRTREVLLFSVIFIVIIFSSIQFVRTIYEIQIENYDLYKNNTQSYRVETDILYALRGNIYDRNNDPLTMSINSYELGVHPEKVIGKVDELSGLLNTFVEKNQQEIYDLLISNKKFVFIDRNVSSDTAEFLQGVLSDYHGWDLQRRFERVNLIDQTVHFIGTVDIDGNGTEGIELVYDDKLKGEDGSRTYEAAQNGTRIPQGKITTIEPKHGQDIYLTIDSDLQFESSSQCKLAIQETGAERCSIILMNANNGEIYALAEEGISSILDINLISIRGKYEPGSALKIFTVGSVLESNKTSVDTVYNVPDRIAKLDNACMDGYEGDKGCFYDFLPHEVEQLTVKEIIEKSSNVGIIKILDGSSVGEIEGFLLRFGFNSITGVEVPGEIKGNFQSYKKCKTCLASMSIGYSIGVTQVQMVKAYGIIANGGIDISPTLIKTDMEGIKSENRVISNELAEELRGLLINVVNGENGTARGIKREDLIIGGKTGTSKSYIEDQNYSESKYNTSFTGFFETDRGPIVASVILWHAIDSQRSEYVTGGSTAAPIFAEIVDNIVKRNILDGK